MDLAKKIKKIKKENTYRFKSIDFEGYVKTSLEIEEFYEKNKEVILKDKGKLKRRLEYLNLKINKKRNIKENITYAIILGIIIFILVKGSEMLNNYLTNDLPKNIQVYNEMNEKFNEISNNTEYINKENIEEIDNLLLKLNKLINFMKLFTYFGIIYIFVATKLSEKLLDELFIDDSFYGQKLMLKELNIIDSLLCQIFISEQKLIELQTDNSGGSRDKIDCYLEIAEKYKNEIKK